jgi:hypothetical protein
MEQTSTANSLSLRTAHLHRSFPNKSPRASRASINCYRGISQQSLTDSYWPGCFLSRRSAKKRALRSSKLSEPGRPTFAKRELHNFTP